MSQTLGELLNRLATSGGIDANDDALKGILTNTAVSGLELPDAIVSAIDSNLLTVESAKNNPVLKNHFTALALGGVDSELDRLQTQFGFDQPTIDELKNEQSSYKRIGMMAEKIKALESAKIGQSQQGKDVLQGEIDKLNQSILDVQQSHQNEIKTLNANHRQGIQNLLLKTQLGNYDYSLPTSKEVAITTAEQIIFGELAKQGGKVVLNDNNELMLKQAENPEMDFFVNNVKVGFKDFAESTLAQHKLLKTVETPPPGTPQGTPQGTPPAQPASNSFAAAAQANIDNLSNANQ